MCYKHFTLLEREILQVLLAKGLTIEKIAKLLKKNKSSIYREIKRNSNCDNYIPVIAEEKYIERRKRCRPMKKLKNIDMFNFCYDKMVNFNWSPEQISGRLRQEHNQLQISYTTIYREV